jgi:carbon-monoxide dehydrogenase small subunit
LSLTANCVDDEITTVEGLSSPLALSPLQAAMVSAGAIQCGFCTPGMLITLTALLQERPRPTQQEIRIAVSSNLCRCTGYQKIVDAVVAMTEKNAAA